MTILTLSNFGPTLEFAPLRPPKKTRGLNWWKALNSLSFPYGWPYSEEFTNLWGKALIYPHLISIPYPHVPIIPDGSWLYSKIVLTGWRFYKPQSFHQWQESFQHRPDSPLRRRIARFRPEVSMVKTLG